MNRWGWLCECATACVALAWGLVCGAGETVLVQINSPMVYIYGSSDPGIGMTWTAQDYVPTGWNSGTYGVGYDTGTPNAGALLKTPIPSGQKFIYTRAEFQMSDVSAVQNMYLGCDFDDGYAAWVNGTLVHRGRIAESTALAWNLTPDNDESSNGSTPNYEVYEPLVDITALAKPTLTVGTNVLAVAIWNISTSSTDLVLVPWLAINHPTSIVGTPVSGTLTGNITWMLANSPYVVVGNTTLAKGATLTIEPGVEVRVRGGLSVAIKGTFSAIGTQQQHITFDRDGTSNWGEILVDYDGDGTIRPATMKYCDIRHVSTGVHVLGTGQSPVLVEDCAIDLWTSLAVKWDQDGGLGCNNLIFRRCRFGMDSGGPLPCEAINGYHSHAIVEYCTFAPQGGYSDAVDLANSRWADGNWPICRYNVLLGGQDDGIDYDDSDGIIEGNIIMNRFPSGYDPPAVPDSAHYPPPGNGPNGGGTTGNEGSSPVILNNVIYHCYYGIGYKNGAQPTILNNTIIDCTWGVVVYSANDIPNPGPAHAILRNNILWNCGDPIRRRWYDTDGIISTVDVAYCAIDAKEEGWLYDDVEQGWVWAGEGNVALTANPLGDYGHDDYGPQPGSPVIDAGYAGLVPYEAGQWPVPSTDCLGHAREDDPSMPNTGVGTPPYVDLGAVEYLYPMPADVIPDRCVNVADLLRVRNDMGKASNPGDPLATDVNRDGVVNVADLLIVRNSLGKGSGC